MKNIAFEITRFRATTESDGGEDAGVRPSDRYTSSWRVYRLLSPIEVKDSDLSPIEYLTKYSTGSITLFFVADKNGVRVNRRSVPIHDAFSKLAIIEYEPSPELWELLRAEEEKNYEHMIALFSVPDKDALLVEGDRLEESGHKNLSLICKHLAI